MMDDGLHRLQAARWVIGLGRFGWGLLVVAAAWSLLGVLFAGAWAALAVPLLLAGYAAAWGALVRAFGAHRRGAWRLLVGLTGLDLLWAAGGWLIGRPVSVPIALWAVGHALFLALLLHRDSRDWVAAGGPGVPVAAGTGTDPGARH